MKRHGFFIKHAGNFFEIMLIFAVNFLTCRSKSAIYLFNYTQSKNYCTLLSRFPSYVLHMCICSLTSSVLYKQDREILKILKSIQYFWTSLVFNRFLMAS